MAKTSSPEEKDPLNFSGLHRSSYNRVIAGVCAGLGEFFSIDPIIVRILFILLTIFSASGILLYLILWLIMPESADTRYDAQSESIKQNASEIKEKVKSFAHDINFTHKNHEESKFWWGIAIIVLGFLALFHNFGLFEIFSIGKLWPVILVIIGISILKKRR